MGLSPGEALEGLTDVMVGLEGVYGLEGSPVGAEDEGMAGAWQLCVALGEVRVRRFLSGAPGRGRGPRGRPIGTPGGPVLPAPAGAPAERLLANTPPLDGPLFLL